MRIQPPTECPSCLGALTQVKDQLYCRNAECGDKQFKAVEHFASTLKIKGLGPSTIRKLDLRSPKDIYTLDSMDDTLGSKIAEKLRLEIENSKNAPLNMVLPALGIPLIGQTAADKLANVVHKLNEITPSVCKEAGLGEKATNNLMDFLQKFDYDLPFRFEFAKKSAQNGIVCITGKLTSYSNKAEATKVLEANGYTVKSSLTKDVQFLVNEGGQESAKTAKARESGVTIINNLKQFLGE